MHTIIIVVMLAGLLVGCNVSGGRMGEIQSPNPPAIWHAIL